MNQWIAALEIFIIGFGGVFAGLILLMWAIQLSAFLTKQFTQKKKV